MPFNSFSQFLFVGGAVVAILAILNIAYEFLIEFRLRQKVNRAFFTDIAHPNSTEASGVPSRYLIRYFESAVAQLKSDYREIAEWGKINLIIRWTSGIFLLAEAAIIWSIGSIFIATIVSIFIGLATYFLLVHYLKSHRYNLILRDMPQAIDGIIRCISSGFDLNRSLTIVASEAIPELRVEFQMLLRNRDFGLSLGDAFFRMAARLKSPDIIYLATLISIQERSGGPLIEALDSLSHILKSREKLRQKRMIATAEARTSALILGGLPIIVAFVLLTTNQSYRDVLFSTQAGHLFLLGAVSLLGIGSFIMYRMVRLGVR